MEEVYFIPKSILDKILGAMDPFTRAIAENHWLSSLKRYQFDQVRLSKEMISSILDHPKSHCDANDYHRVLPVLEREMTLLAYLAGTDFVGFLAEQKLGGRGLYNLLYYRNDNKKAPLSQDKAEVALRMFTELFYDYIEKTAQTLGNKNKDF